MAYEFKVITQEQAENIAYNWHYDGDYSFYDMEADEEDLVEFISPEKRGDSVFAITEGNEMVGFFSATKIADRVFDIGLGMRPDLTGKGKGVEFLSAGMAFLQSKYAPEKITLSVAKFNQRAINVYRRVGFKDTKTFFQDTNGSTFEFLMMEYNYM